MHSVLELSNAIFSVHVEQWTRTSFSLARGLWIVRTSFSLARGLWIRTSGCTQCKKSGVFRNFIGGAFLVVVLAFSFWILGIESEAGEGILRVRTLRARPLPNRIPSPQALRRLLLAYTIFQLNE